MAQAGVVLLSGEARTRPLMGRWPLAEWGIRQGLADCDLCSLFSGSLTECNIAFGFVDPPDSEGDHDLDPNFSGDAPENIKKALNPYFKKKQNKTARRPWAACSITAWVFCGWIYFAHLTAAQEAGGRLCRNFGCSSQPGGSAGWSSKGTWSGLWCFLSNTWPNL